MRAALLWWMAWPAVAAGLGGRIESLLVSSEAGRLAFWGIRVADAATAETLFEKNADHLFVPASNVKLFTTALALVKLGPEFRFETRVLAETAPDPSGRLRGDLRLVGGGDPSLSGRDYPYRKGPVTGDPLRGLEELADEIVARGIRVVDGDIVGDDSLYPWEPYPEGWTQGDALWDYGAPVSALTLNDNMMWLTLHPGAKPGWPAVVSLRPAVEYYVVHNHTVTRERAEDRVAIARLPGTRELRIWGEIGLRDPERTFELAVDDPARYAAAALADALLRRGVVIRGVPRAQHRPDSVATAGSAFFELARRSSPPLAEMLKVVNKESQNLHAELLLRAVGRACRGSATRRAGLEEMQAWLKQAGVASDAVRLEDGSGLSRRNLATPRAIAQLLVYMYNGGYRAAWLESLPVGGEDGTLEHRFEGAAEGRRIRAKTGTLARASALAGYAATPSGRLLAFAILVNHHAAPTSEVRRLIDRISIVIAQGG
ncbi:MAG: D-alanyl-D-alanine carboxypeptidase/D-alanyl-D-alanine-endopeptidase [Bryobacterales bacterium]|nr:D-alanyl-D-alanine carboxypeptidase/D-alanyl-D-alanine-endopeptidase [Bryobacteraceae bacterium]MDW8355458.1 D-alanyl-D-alanine carboxypeptidase/D-alanyl-D-alanine-endopeptidase [Bryobacterales bacterium]